MSAATKLLQALKNGAMLTVKQIENRFNVVNGRDLVYRLRQEGYPIFLKSYMNSKGVMRNKYSFGSPTKTVMARAYNAMGARYLGMSNPSKN